MNDVEKLESRFGKPLRQIIAEEHWGRGVSLNRLSIESGVCRQAILLRCRKLGIKTMNRKEIEKYLDRSGKNSVWWGKKNPAASKRMKENNPAQNKEVRIRMSKSLSDFFRSNLLPQEIAFSEILKQNKIDFIPQYPIGQYIVDFFVPDNMLCIEIDSTDKWGKKRRLAAVEKDLWLKRRGYSVLRINKKLLSEKRLILDILLANNVIRN